MNFIIYIWISCFDILKSVDGNRHLNSCGEICYHEYWIRRYWRRSHLINGLSDELPENRLDFGMVGLDTVALAPTRSESTDYKARIEQRRRKSEDSLDYEQLPQ